MIVEKKQFSFKFDDVDSHGMIRGFASTFGNEDLGSDIVDKGAFKKTIQENIKWPILADHESRSHIGFNLRAQETDQGLLVEGQLNLDVQLAREKYALAKQALKEGATMGLSIGYQTIKAEPDRKNPRIRHIKEVKLWEYSIVPFPMNTLAFITDAKSALSTGVDVDKVKQLITQLKNMGCTESDLLMALQGEAAEKESDPKMIQSLDQMILALKTNQ